MNIGFLSEALPYLPSVGGFRLYGANVIRHLARRHQIDLVSLTAGADVVHLDWARQHCRSVRTIPMDGGTLLARLRSLASSYVAASPLRYRREVLRAVKEGVQSHAWDVLHVEGMYAAGLVGGLDISIPKILSAHDCLTLRAQEMLTCARSMRGRVRYHALEHFHRRYERLVYPRFDRSVFVAARDVAAVRMIAPTARTAVVSNGVDVEYYSTTAGRKAECDLVFHGHLGYLPNVDAAVSFARGILPLVRRQAPEAVFHLIGAEPEEAVVELSSEPGIRLSANLPDLRAAVGSGSVYVCAVRHGTGVKNKLLEAMAMGVPIVSYPNAIAGLECVSGRHLLVADDPAGFAECVVRLLRDPGLAERLGIAGRRLVEERYSWASRAGSFERLYETAIAERAVSAIHSGSGAQAHGA